MRFYLFSKLLDRSSFYLRSFIGNTPLFAHIYSFNSKIIETCLRAQQKHTKCANLTEGSRVENLVWSGGIIWSENNL